MLCVKIPTGDPYFCLAAEEYLLHNHSGNLFVVWISKPAVIVGKHQNAQAEINHRYVYDHNILVARRLSGGGTVFHDPGNLNFSFITNEEPGRLIDFKRYAMPVIGFLEQMGIPATLGVKNEILTRGLKVSGNAGHVFKNRVLHHGTLLFDTDLEALHGSLASNNARYHSRAVQSNPARVANLVDFLTETIDIDVLSTRLLKYIQEKYQGKMYDLKAEEIESISLQAKVKYTTWEWIFGYSPEYRFENEFYPGNKAVKITFTGQKGIITDFVIQTDLLTEETGSHFSGMMNGCRHTWDDLLTLAGNLKLPGIPDDKITDFMMDNLF